MYRELLCGTPLLEWAGCWDGTSYDSEKISRHAGFPLFLPFFR